MRIVPIVIPTLIAASPASAHVGHLGELAGHDHWIAGAAVGAAVLAGVLAGLRADRKAKAGQGEPEDARDAPERGAGA